MTRQCNDPEKSTQFSLWLRGQLPDQKTNVFCIDSKKSKDEAYSNTNIDYMWTDYKSKKWMLIEEKRGFGNGLPEISYSQKQSYSVLNRAFLTDENYKGFYVIKFENTNPEDGRIFKQELCGKLEEISIEQLLDFLQFKLL
jgi:hypothetical protein